MAVELRNRDVGAMDYSSMAATLKKGTTQIVETKSPHLEKVIAELTAAVQEFAKARDPHFSKEIEKDKGHTDNVSKFMQDFFKRGQKPDKLRKDDNKNISLLTKVNSKLYHASQSLNTFWVSVGKFSPNAIKQITQAINASECCMAATRAAGTGANRDTNAASGASKAAASATGGGGGGDIDDAAAGGGSGGGGAGGAGNWGKLAKFIGGAKKTLFIASAAMAGIYKWAVQTVDLDPITHIFAGAAKESNAFRENLRQTLHQQIGFTAANRDAEVVYRDITNSVSATGVRRGEFQAVWLKNLQRGIALESKSDKDQQMGVKRMKSVTTSALHTAQQLGMQTDAVNDMFMDWHMHLFMSANQIADMSRHMQTVARTTGVTGAELQKAMGHVDKISKTLKDAGLASTSALKNTTQIMALAQKYGVADKVSELMTAMSSSSAFFNADKATQALLTRAASRMKDEKGNSLVGALQAGAITQSPKLTRQMFQGVQDDMRDLFTQAASGAFGAMGVDTKTMDLGQLDKHMQQLAEKAGAGDAQAQMAMRALDNLAKQRGMNIGDLPGIAKTAIENAKTAGERMDDMAKREQEMQKGKERGTEAHHQLQKQLAEAQTNAAMTGFTDLQETLRLEGKKSYSELSEQAKKTLNEKLNETMGKEKAQDFVKNMNANAGKMLDTINNRAKAAGLDMNKLLKSRGITGGMEEAARSIQQGGVEGERTMLMVNEALQEISKKERQGQDPVTAIRGDLTELNNMLGEGIDTMIGWLEDIFNKIDSLLGITSSKWVYWGGLIVTTLASILAATSLMKGAMSLLGMGGGGGGMLGGMSMAGAAKIGVGTAGVAWTVKDFIQGFQEGGMAEGIQRAIFSTKGEEAQTYESALSTVGKFAAMGSYFGPFGTAIGAITGECIVLGRAIGEGAAAISDYNKEMAKSKELDKAAKEVGAKGLETREKVTTALADAGNVKELEIRVQSAQKDIEANEKRAARISELESMWWVNMTSEQTAELSRLRDHAKQQAVFSPEVLAQNLADAQKKLATAKEVAAGAAPVAAPRTPEERRADAAATDMAERATERGSIYTHDITLEGSLKSISDLLATYLPQIVKTVGSTSALGLGLFSSDQGSEANSQAHENYLQGMVQKANQGDAGAQNTLRALDYAAKQKGFGNHKEMQMVEAGLFSPGQGKEANSVTEIQRAMETLPIKGRATQKNEGLFTENNISDAMSESIKEYVDSNLNTISNSASSALNSKAEAKKILAETSRVLDYEQTASEAAEVSTNLLDYTEAMKGEVNTLALTRTNAENMMERDRAGENTATTALVPNMDDMSDYLTEEQPRILREMIEVLQAIKDNTGNKSYLSNIIGAISGGVPPISRLAVKNIARDTTTGSWDLAFGEDSPGAVSTDGRGGSA